MSIFKPLFCQRRWLVLLVAWLVSIPAAECVFRLAGGKPSDDLLGLFIPFGNGSYKLGSWVDTEATWAAGRFSVHTDGLGLRCDASHRLAAKSGDRVDVLFLGDSQGFGHGVSFEESVAGSAAELALRGGVRCANASVGGHAILNQFELVQWLQNTQRLRILHYVFLLTPLMIQNIDDYAGATVGQDGRLYDKPPDSFARLRLWAKTHCVLYGSMRDAARNAGIGSKPKADAPTVFKLYGTGDPDERVRDKFVAFLQRFRGFAAQHGADVHLVYLPMTVEVDSEALHHAAASQGLSLDCDRPLRICSAAAARLGMHVHNLRPVLERRHAQGDPLRLTGDFHYNRALSLDCGASIWTDLKTVIQKTAINQSAN